MSDRLQTDELKASYEAVIRKSAELALMPVEEMLADLERSETVGAIMDPTLYRTYLYSRKPEMLKDVLRKAVALKATVKRWQREVLQDPEAFK